ncbi:MAG: tRNA 2-thiouridine(34) synthase MnmA [Gammaproteobacteria bacterium]|nr:MAG: tRNA 2-thiouridine(34) synthase MnmA [Gammaproteobacteria bacterium]
MSRRVIVGMSGGVDSSVAACLLQQQGHEVQGLFMKNWEGDDAGEQCSAAQDFQDAKDVCARLDIPLHAANFSREYWERVFSYFLEEYRAGRTPNPDVLCNKEIKFKSFLDHALQLGAASIATGHYARVLQRDGGFYLLKARDLNKDQSYFLYTLGQAQLAKTIFPLGEMTKPEVRAIAARHGFVNAAKKDSTGICFIGERNFKNFLARYLPAQPGEIRSVDGTLLGKHDGLMYYTLGQRQGLGIGGRRGAGEEPWYVAGKDMAGNVLIVAQGHDHKRLYSRSLTASCLCWVSGREPQTPLPCMAKTRYRQSDQPCRITGIKNGVCEVTFDKPQWAVTPGQSVVFYQGDECLGGGVIEATRE